MNSIAGFLSQSIHILNHYIVHVRYITILFVNYSSMKPTIMREKEKKDLRSLFLSVCTHQGKAMGGHNENTAAYELGVGPQQGLNLPAL